MSSFSIFVLKFKMNTPAWPQSENCENYNGSTSCGFANLCFQEFEYFKGHHQAIELRKWIYERAYL